MERSTTHPNLEMNSAFDMRNPNKIRALYGVFTHNGARFHQGSGEGYRFIADKILSIDQFNPSMAARLSTAYHQFIRLDNGRHNLMKQELERIVGFKNLSVGVYEIISKTLGT